MNLRKRSDPSRKHAPILACQIQGAVVPCDYHSASVPTSKAILRPFPRSFFRAARAQLADAMLLCKSTTKLREDDRFARRLLVRSGELPQFKSRPSPPFPLRGGVGPYALRATHRIIFARKKFSTNFYFAPLISQFTSRYRAIVCAFRPHQSTMCR